MAASAAGSGHGLACPAVGCFSAPRPAPGPVPARRRRCPLVWRDDPDRDWERFGAEDPYYAVLNTEAYRRDRLDAAVVAEVLDSGEATVRGFLRRVEGHFGPLPTKRALEYGCGVGRLLLPLSRRFDSVVGVDVSPSMLREARANLQEAGVANVELLEPDNGQWRTCGAFDYVLCYLVLQHVPVRRGEAILRSLFESVGLGGAASVHLTYGRSGPRWRQPLHVLRRKFRPLHWAINLAAGRPWHDPLMHTHLYSLPRILRIARETGLENLVLQPVQHADHEGVVIHAARARSG